MLHAVFYFGPLFFVPVEVLGQRVAGMSTGFSNMFANFGGLSAAYALGLVKATTSGLVYPGIPGNERAVRGRPGADPWCWRG